MFSRGLSSHGSGASPLAGRLHVQAGPGRALGVLVGLEEAADHAGGVVAVARGHRHRRRHGEGERRRPGPRRSSLGSGGLPAQRRDGVATMTPTHKTAVMISTTARVLSTLGLRNAVTSPSRSKTAHSPSTSSAVTKIPRMMPPASRRLAAIRPSPGTTVPATVNPTVRPNSLSLAARRGASSGSWSAGARPGSSPSGWSAEVGLSRPLSADSAESSSGDQLPVLRLVRHCGLSLGTSCLGPRRSAGPRRRAVATVRPSSHSRRNRRDQGRYWSGRAGFACHRIGSVGCPTVPSAFDGTATVGREASPSPVYGARLLSGLRAQTLSRVQIPPPPPPPGQTRLAAPRSTTWPERLVSVPVSFPPPAGQSRAAGEARKPDTVRPRRGSSGASSRTDAVNWRRPVVVGPMT